MKKILKCYPKPILFYRLTDNISEMQCDSYNSILVLRCKIMQHNTGGKCNTGGKHNFKYWQTCQSGTSRFFWWRTLITHTQKIDDSRWSEWQTIHSTLSLILSLLLTLPWSIDRPCQCIASQALFLKNSYHTIKKSRHYFCLILGSSTDHCSRSSILYQSASHILSKLSYHRYLLISFSSFFRFKPQQQP